MSESTTVQVNFGRPMPVFPLNTLALMPHGVNVLYIFEPRYRQMVSDALDGPGQIAVAMFQGARWLNEYHGRPPIRPVVCLGQIIEHNKESTGNYHVVLQGLCRAQVINELPPREGKLYREAYLEPLDKKPTDELELEPFRQNVIEAIKHDRLADLKVASGMLEHLNDPKVPTSAILEVLGFTFVTDAEDRYRLLATRSAKQRAAMVAGELMDIARLLRQAQPQRQTDAPKGCHWN